MTDQTETPDLAELRRLLDELPNGMHHPHWSGNTRSPGNMELSAWVPGWGRASLMRPKRWGMNGARFQFLDFDTVMMVDADRLVKYEVGNRHVTGVQNRDGSVYREDIEDIDHPVARLIVGLLEAAPALLDAAAERDALGRRGDTLARDLGAAVVRADRAESERDALAAKVDRLTAGRDDTPRDDSAWATPGQAWAALLDAQPGERVEMLAGALRALEAEHSCIVEFHRGSAERLAAAAPVLSAAQAWRRAIARRDEARAHIHESEELWTAYIALCRDETAKRDELRAALDEETQA